jgi:hypothetical protein
VQLSLKFSRLVDNDPPKFVEDLLTAYFKSCDEDTLSVHDGVLRVQWYQKCIQRYKDQILQLGGVGPEWKEVSQLLNQLTEVMRWIEEVLCFAMVDQEGLVASYQGQMLMYRAGGSW